MSLPQPQAYKPSPLSIGSPRTSPFRRPESPASQSYRASSPGGSPSSRPITPTASPTKPHQPLLTSPSKLQTASTPLTSTSGDTPSPAWTPRGLTPLSAAAGNRTPSRSPTRSSSSSSNATAIPPVAAASTTQPPPPPPPAQPPAPLFSPRTATSSSSTSKDYPKNHAPPPSSSSSSSSLSSLPPTLLHQLRQTFSLLDRSSTGQVTRADVSAQLADLGLPSGPSDITPFFPPGSPQTLPLAQFLGQLAGVLTQFSSQEELLNAFGAFDERDCGEVDWAGLRDSVVNTGGGEDLTETEVNMAVEGFVGRKAFGQGGRERGEVFRYRQWVGGVLGGGEEEGKGTVA